MDQRNDLNVSDETEDIEIVDRSNTIILEGTVLDGDWVIGKQVGSTEHANIYSVTHQGDDDDSDVTYEARSYTFDGISPQVKSNRARAIRRLSRRTVLSTTWNDLRVVIYRTGAVTKEKKGDLEALPEETLIVESSYKIPKQKTTRQRESDRLRQLSRRRRVKQERKNAVSQDEDIRIQDQEGLDGKIREQVPPATRSQVEDYLAAREKDVMTDGKKALQEFIALVEAHESVLFETDNQKLQAAIKEPERYLHYVTSRILQDHVDKNLGSLRMEFKILSGEFDDLPNLIPDTEELMQKLQLKLRDIRKTREMCKTK